MSVVWAILLLLLSAAQAEAVAYVQGCSANANATSVSCTMAASTDAGNSIIAGLGMGAFTRNLLSVTTTNGTCTIDTPKNIQTTTAIGMYVASCRVTSSGTQTITATWDLSGQKFIVAEEYSGVETASAFDTSAGAMGSSTTCSATTGVTTTPNQLVFGFCEIGADPAAAGSDGCTLRTNFQPATGESWITVDKTVTTAAAQTCSATVVTGDWLMITATYRIVPPAVAGGYILTEASDCINAENDDRLITEDVSAGVGPCAAAGAVTVPERSKMGVGT